MEVSCTWLDRPPSSESLQKEEAEQRMTADAGCAWIRTLAINEDPTVSDFSVSGAVGCSALLWPQLTTVMAQLPRMTQLLLQASGGPKPVTRENRRSSRSRDTAAFNTASFNPAPRSKPEPEVWNIRRKDIFRHFRAVMPEVCGLAEKILDKKSLAIRVESVPGMGTLNKRMTVLDAEVQLDFESLQTHYPRFAAMLQHFELISVIAKNSTTGACLFEFSIEVGCCRLRTHYLDQDWAWPSVAKHPAAPVQVGEEGLELDVECQLSLRLLGLSLAAVSLPKLDMQVEVRPGLLKAKCKPDEEPAEQTEDAGILASFQSAAAAIGESAANLVYDCDLMKRLTQERLAFEFAKQDFADAKGGSEKEEPTRMRFEASFAMPYAPSAEMVSQCLKDFLTNQLKKMDVLRLYADFLAALGNDLLKLATTEKAKAEGESASKEASQAAAGASGSNELFF